MNDFNEWKSFEYLNSGVQLWVFKKSATAKKFKAWHVKTDAEIEALFKEIAIKQVKHTTEYLPYSPIAQNNESSCLTHSLENTEGLLALLALVDQPEHENTDAKLVHLKGAAGYLVKFNKGNSTVYAVRRTAPTWKPKIRNSLINAIFINGELSSSPQETFSFDAFFDFYCCQSSVFIKTKRSFESTMSEKKVYEKRFNDFLKMPDLIEIFSDVEPLKKYIGSNSMQLRRVVVIQEKSIYKQPNFIQKLQHVNAIRNYGLNFDNAGKIIVTAETVKTVMSILLDHRLISEITENIYDVPDAEKIQS